jgi:hypothetical protein
VKKRISKQTAMKFREPLGNSLETYAKINWKNLKEMDKFLDENDQSKLNVEYISHPNRFITINEIEAATVFPKKKSPGSDGLIT